jgi:hypothetical protein
MLRCFIFLKDQRGLFQDSPRRRFHWWALFVVEGHLARLITPVSPPGGLQFAVNLRSTNPFKTYFTSDIAIWHLLTVNNILTSMCE